MSEVIGWVISTDHLWEEGDVIKSRKGMVFVVKGTKEEVIALANDKSVRQHFKLFDDDNNINYEGFATPETEFQPLNWAMNDVGSTRIDYRNPKTGKYETL